MDPSAAPIVIATGNPHKVAELRAILAALGLHAVGLDDPSLPGPFPEPAETGATFEENAALKALGYARRTGRVCIADDSGLEVDALGGLPGVISAHYATDGRDDGTPPPGGAGRAGRDARNNERLLRELARFPFERRGARFVCVMAAAAPGPPSGGEVGPRVLASARGTVEGRIGVPPAVPRGAHGFGYDPLFLLAPDFARTSAELTPDEKNALSHRARAARALAPRLRYALESRANSAAGDAP